MKHVTNIYDPRRPDATQYFHFSPAAKGEPEKEQIEWANYLNWLSQFTIGRPEATRWRTVEELEKMGMVGVYETTKNKTP